jgi:hypothetical protein
MQRLLTFFRTEFPVSTQLIFAGMHRTSGDHPYEEK